MKQFLEFVKKEFFHIFRDSRTMLILLGMPIAQILLFGFAISTEIKNVNVAVFDLSKDKNTTQITQRIDASEYFTLVENLHSSSQIDDVLKNGSVSMVLVFNSNFSSNLLQTGEAAIQVIVDATDPNQATTMTNYVNNILSQYQQELNTTHNNAGFQIIPNIRMLYNPQMESAYNFVPGVMGLILMLICAMMTSIAIVREKERGSMEVLLASPIKPILIIISKAVPYFVLSIVNLTSILLISVFALNVPIEGNFALIILSSFLFILVSLLLGLFISNVANTQVAAMLISGMGLMMPTMILSGMIFPIDSMPIILQCFSSIIPARWYIEITRKLMIQGVDGIYVIKEFTIMCIMIIVLLFVSLRTFKSRL